MRGIGYCRVSTDEQVVDGFSLDTQEREIKEYCKNNNIELLRVYVDSGVSAFKFPLCERPEGKFVFEHLVNSDVDCIVSISNDRMFRQVGDAAAVRDISKKNDVKILYTRQQYIEEMDDFSSFIVDSFSNVMNQAYSLQYAVKVKKGLENKIRKGEWVGPAPYGYNLVDSHLQINEEQSNVVKLIFDLYLSKSWGAEKICNYLNQQNIQPPSEKSKYWSKTSILCFLKNQVYTGITVFGKRAPKRSGKKYNSKSQWLVIEGTHTPIISKEDFETVQMTMEKKRRNIGAEKIDRSQISKAPLAGLMFCSNCGNVYTSTSGISSSGKKIDYYQCGSKRHGKTVCKRHNIPSLLIEKFVLYRIKEILTSNMYKERFEEQLKIRIDTLKSKKKDISEIKNNISKLSNQKEKLVNLIIEESSEQIRNTYREKLNSVLDQIQVQEEILNSYSLIDIEFEEEQIRKQFQDSYNNVSYKDFQELDREQQKILFNTLIEKIVIDEFYVPGEKEVCLNISIYMKIPGYDPKYSLQFKKDLKNLEKKNANTFKKCSHLDGGEGGI